MQLCGFVINCCGETGSQKEKFGTFTNVLISLCCAVFRCVELSFLIKKYALQNKSYRC